MTRRALLQAVNALGKCVEDVCDAHERELDRLRTELAEWIALTKQKDLEIGMLKQQLNDLMRQHKAGGNNNP